MLNNVPLVSQSLAQTQPLINNNFSVIDTAFSVNHIQYSDPSGSQGKHFFVEFPMQSSIPATIANEVGLYCQNSTLTSQPELVFSHQSGSTAPAAAKIVEFTSAGWAMPGWARLPSGILLKWGSIGPSIASTPLTVTFPTGSTIPVFSSIYTVMISPQEANTVTSPFDHVIVTQKVTTTNFVINCHDNISSTITVNYVAIGI
ncbi:MAG TPA: hypothetical protein VHA52_02310 [Candidatus Babeliaceae bacterium]|nr:hypothetical protein [Candidatus Babeliaceae bacterium]